jgi:hypothetical protein
LRLKLAASIGAIPINFNATNPVTGILAAEPNGVTRSLDCVDYEAINSSRAIDLDIILRQQIAITHLHGVVSVYMGNETMSMSMTSFWDNSASYGEWGCGSFGAGGRVGEFAC